MVSVNTFDSRPEGRGIESCRIPPNFSGISTEFLRKVRAFALHPGKVLKISNRKAGKSKWVFVHKVPLHPGAAETYMDAPRVKDLITLIVKEAYVQVGDAIFRQMKGIPMGVNPACYFANLYLFMYELAFFERLLVFETHTSRRVCEAFRFAGRLIDDVDIMTHENKPSCQSFCTPTNNT